MLNAPPPSIPNMKLPPDPGNDTRRAASQAKMMERAMTIVATLGEPIDPARTDCTGYQIEYVADGRMKVYQPSGEGGAVVDLVNHACECRCFENALWCKHYAAACMACYQWFGDVWPQIVGARTLAP